MKTLNLRQWTETLTTDTTEPVLGSVFTFVCCFFLVLREWVQMAITRNILQQYVRQSSKKYHSYIILWNSCILAAILDIRWRTKWWLFPFLGTPIDHSLWKILKIALKFGVSTLLSNCSQTEPPLFPDDSHIGSTRMRLLFENSL